MLNLPVKMIKIKDFSRPLSGFQSKFNFQGLLKDFPTVFKRPVYSSTFQASMNPDIILDSNQNHTENTSPAYMVCYNLRQNNVGHP